MGASVAGLAEIHAAAQWGRICAVAAEGQRDLQEFATAAPDILPVKPFDPTLFGTVCLANAFCAPSLTADRLQLANRASLWGFAVDWQIDYLATTGDVVGEVVRRCLAIADGAAPAEDDSLGRLLAGIRDQLSTVIEFDGLRPTWREELRRMLEAMSREWEWRSVAALPTLDDYVDNADNLGSSFVNLSHWIFTSEACSPDDLDHVTAASREEQKVIRLLNDLGTYRRDLAWGDLNVLMLGVDRGEVAERIAVIVDRCHELFDPLRTSQPDFVRFLERQIGFCTGFYRITDYWGEL